MPHAPITTLAEYDLIDDQECLDGYQGAFRGDPEPGDNHSRSYHHGWRCRMMDWGEIKDAGDHAKLTRSVMDRDRVQCGLKPKWPEHMKVQM